MKKPQPLVTLVALVTFAALLPSLAFSQGVTLKSGATSDLATVDSNKNMRVAPGAGTRPTYACSAGGLATTALYNLSIEASAGTGFKLAKVCVGVSNATAAALVTVTIQRRTTASSGGTAATAEGTATPAVSKFDPVDANFGGICRITSTLGTAGAILDQWGFTVGEIGAGAADPTSEAVLCVPYGENGAKMPVVQAGVANGLSINVSAPGAGGLASGSISAVIIYE